MERLLKTGNTWGVGDAPWIDSLFDNLKNKKYDEVKLVLKEKNIDVNQLMLLGWTSYGGTLAWKAGYGASLLHLTAAEGDLEAVKLMVELGGDPCLKTTAGRETALDLASSSEVREYLKTLVPEDSHPVSSPKMTVSQLAKILEHKVPNLITTRHGCFEATVGEGFNFQCMTCESYDRMRFIIPVLKVDNLPREFLLKCLSANFHKALDAKYAVNDGVLWSTFIHPLSSLTTAQIEDAVDQVITLASTTGTKFCSSGLQFVGNVGKMV